MPIQPGGFVGMVDRDVFDEYLRVCARPSAAPRACKARSSASSGRPAPTPPCITWTAPAPSNPCTRASVIGADGAVSAVGKQNVPGLPHHVFAYHEIIRAPANDFDAACCDVYYDGEYSPDFYAWIFPHGDTVSVGTGSAKKGFSLRGSVRCPAPQDGSGRHADPALRGGAAAAASAETLGQRTDVVLAGDAAGCVAPASGEGILLRHARRPPGRGCGGRNPCVPAMRARWAARAAAS